MKRLCVFPNDPISSYYRKGEIKPRYYNPCNLFDEVHVLSPCHADVDEKEVQAIAGEADLRIRPIGRPGPAAMLLPAYRKRVLALLREIKPDVVRGYNPLLAGWLAVYCGQRLGIPSVVSLHNNYDRDVKELIKRGVVKPSPRNLMYWLLLSCTEGYVLRSAQKVLCAYRFPVEYARKHGARDITVIYNRIDTERFKPCPHLSKDGKLTILCVSNLIEAKSPEHIVRAAQGLDIRLRIIGDGPLRARLGRLVSSLGMVHNVELIPAVPHSEIHRHYQEADLFAIANRYGGVSMPVMEAMATGLPVVTLKPRWEETPELVGDCAVVVEDSPEGFREGLRKLLADPELRATLGHIGRSKMVQLDGSIMEKKEADLYRELLSLAEPLQGSYVGESACYGGGADDAWPRYSS